MLTVKKLGVMHALRFKLGIGYHRYIEHDGFVMDGRRIQVRGAHAPPNANRLGICVAGWNGNMEHPEWAWSERQWQSLINEMYYWGDRLPNLLWCGHNQTKATLCPGLNLRNELIDRGFDQPERLMEGRIF